MPAKMFKYSKKFISIFLSLAIVFASLVLAVKTQTVSAADAGNYFVRVTYKVTGTNNINGSYGGFDTEKNDTAGISIGYVANNGTANTTDYYDWDIGDNVESSTGTYTETATVSGFPNILYCYLDDNFALSSACFQVTKLEVGSSSTSSLTTLWTGTMQVKSKINPYAASVSWDGTYKIDYFNSDSDTYVSNPSWTWDKPSAATCTLSAGTSALTVGKTSSVSTAALTGTIKDQYGVNWYQDPVFTLSEGASGSKSDISGYTLSGGKLTVAANANYSNGTATSRKVYIQARAGSSAGSILNYKEVTVTNATYKYTFVDGDGSSTTENFLYSASGALPEAPTASKAADNDNHYTFSAWSPAYERTQADTTFTAQFDSDAHINRLSETMPTDGVEGKIYYKCAVCAAKFICTDEGESGDIVSDEALEQESVIPAPAFNQYTSNSIDYDYSLRGASLKIDRNASADYQKLRFTASMAVPAGADLVEFGYVYSQAQYIILITDLTDGGSEKVFKAPCTVKTDHDGIYTFNLVINTKYTNWQKDYVARAYVIYKYKGRTYTVYDKSYSQRSVETVARAVVSSPDETQTVKDYIQAHVLDRLLAG